MSASVASRFTPWAGWISSGLALLINHQGIADLVYFHCEAANPVSTVVVGVASLALAWSGAIFAWRSRTSGADDPDRRTRAFITLVGLLMTALYSVAIVFQMLAGLIIPVCFR